jgi:2-polyprenyl-3-methyl-5-hydroxy-6-metoxy-1,4-benzoquinol methylase
MEKTDTGIGPNSWHPLETGCSGKTLPCTICSTESRYERSFADIFLFRCPACRHCFTDLASLQAPEQYGGEYFDEAHKNWNKHPDVALFERVYRAIADRRANASVLDIGFGKGNLLRYLRERDSKLGLTGIDINPSISNDGIEFLRGDFLTWNFEARFDAIVSLQVIQHVTNPRMFAKRIVELIAQHGLVISNTINEQSMLYDVARWARRLGAGRAYERLYSRHHVNHFNRSSLSRLMEVSGLKTIAHFQHRGPIAAMDIPAPNKWLETVLRAGVWGTFLLGDLTGRSIYQTLVCQR